jgi:uncharacterized protein
MMPQPERPAFRELSEAEAIEVLERNRIGRAAFVVDERIEIVPIHYVYDDRWIFGRTTAGRKFAGLRRNWWVAFEVDEVNTLFDWRSVVVHGGIYVLGDDDDDDAPLRERALASLRRLLPATLTPDDPVPERDVMFGIAVQEITGRAAQPGADE